MICVTRPTPPRQPSRQAPILRKTGELAKLCVVIKTFNIEINIRDHCCKLAWVFCFSLERKVRDRSCKLSKSCDRSGASTGARREAVLVLSFVLLINQGPEP